MVVLTKAAESVFAPYNTDGTARAIVPQDAQVWGSEVEATLDALSDAGTLRGGWDASSGVFPGGGTAALGDAWLVETAGTTGGVTFGEGDRVVAIIANASTSLYAGNWHVIRARGRAYIPGTDAGAGTANAIQITTPEPVIDGSVVMFQLFRDTTASPVTCYINGGAAVTLKTNRGNDASGLTAGMDIWFRYRASDSTARMLNDQDVSALVAQAEAAQAAAEAAAASINQRIYTTMAEAEGDTIQASVKRIQIQFRTSDRIPFSGFHARRASLADLTGYPTQVYFQSVDRFLPDGTTDATNGGIWVIDEVEPYPEMLGAKGDGITPDQSVLAALATFLDVRSGGGTIRTPNDVYLCEAEWELPCGVNLIGPVTLKYTNTGGNGIYCSTNPARLGQHSIIRNVTFGRSGSNGGKAIYTEQDNAPFYTQAPAWIIEGNFFRDLGNAYTYPPDQSGIAAYAWEWCVDLAHSNGSAIRDNDMIGNFNPTIAEAGQFACGGIHLGTEPSNTNGVIAVDISSNRIWYQRNAFDIGEDVLAFWFQKNEVIKCYSGINAAADPGGDGTASQADTRIIDNFITTCTSGINLINRQMLHIIGNHTNSDATYYDNGGGFNGIRLEGCTKYKIRGNSANLGAGHAAWTGTHRAVLLVASDNGSVTDQSVSRYFDEGVYLNGSNNVRIDGVDLTQVSDAAFAFVGTCRYVQIGIVNYVTAEPTNRYYFYDASTDINDLTITADEWVVPYQATTLTVVANAITVTRQEHLVNTLSAAQVVNTITGPSVRNGVRLMLRPSSSAFSLTLSDNTGNLRLSGDFVSTNAQDCILLQYSEVLSAWLELSRSDNA